MENVITLGKLIGLLFLFCPLFLSISCVFENSKNKRNDLAHPVMGTIFLVNWVLACLRSGQSVAHSPQLFHYIPPANKVTFCNTYTINGTYTPSNAFQRARKAVQDLTCTPLAPN